MPLRRTQSNVVPTVRLELTRLSPPPPQDGVSTNSTTSAVATILPFPCCNIAEDPQLTDPCAFTLYQRKREAHAGNGSRHFPECRSPAYFGMSDGRLGEGAFSAPPGAALPAGAAGPGVPVGPEGAAGVPGAAGIPGATGAPLPAVLMTPPWSARAAADRAAVAV